MLSRTANASRRVVGRTADATPRLSKIKSPERCPHCNSKRLIKKGTRKKKLEDLPIFRCRACGRTFGPGPRAIRNKTYPLPEILEALTLYDRGNTLEATAEKISSRYGHQVAPSTISRWLSEHPALTAYRRIRDRGRRLFTPTQVIRTHKLYHRQVYEFAYHRAKLAFLRDGTLDDKRAAGTASTSRFASLADFVESIPQTCPHDLFRREDGGRGSQLAPDFLALDNPARPPGPLHPRPIKRLGSGEAGRRGFPLAQGCMVRHHHSPWGADVDGLRRPRRIRADPHQSPDREGRERAKVRGVRFGRPLKLSPHQRREAIERLDAGDAVMDVARSFGVDRATLYRMKADVSGYQGRLCGFSPSPRRPWLRPFSRCARASAIDTTFGGQSSDLRKARAASSLATSWWTDRMSMSPKAALNLSMVLMLGPQQNHAHWYSISPSSKNGGQGGFRLGP
jgi:transposase-like protein